LYTKEELREQGLHLFRNFMRHLWDYLRLPEPTRAQLSIADTLQFAPERIPGGDRLIIEAFRGIGKSWITSGFCCWNYLNNPDVKILVVSGGKELADSFSTHTKALITGMPLLQHLGLNPDRQSNLLWDLGCIQSVRDPSMKSAGIFGQITGSRADIIIADDIETPKNSYTHILRDRVANLVKEFGDIIKPGGRIIYLGTPHTEQTLYKKLEDRGYMTRIWTSEVPEAPEKYKGKLAPFIQKMIDEGIPALTPTDPVRFDEQELLKKKAEHGRAGYAMQYLLDPSPADIDAHPLKLHDLIVMDCDGKMGPVGLAWGGSRDLVMEGLLPGGFDGDNYHRPAWRSPEMAEWQGTVMWVDPSGKGKDETGYAIVRILNGTLYLVAAGGYRDGYAEATLKGLASVAARHGVNYVVVEDNFGNGMFAQLLKPWLTKLGGGKIDEEYNAWSSTQKEQRICDTLQPVLESHRLVIDGRVIEEDLKVQAETAHYSLIYQLTRMKREKGCIPFDDRVESLAGAVGYWTEKMARDRELAVKEHEEQQQEDGLRKFMQHVVGAAPAEPKAPVWHNEPLATDDDLFNFG
jgi:hypothetical protein